jgi:hypothetical protein
MGSNRNEEKVVAFIGKNAWGTGVITYQSNGEGSARFKCSKINGPDWFTIKAVETLENTSDTINALYQSTGAKRIDPCKKWIAALKAIIKYTLTRSKLVPGNRGVNRRHLSKPCFIFQINKTWGVNVAPNFAQYMWTNQTGTRGSSNLQYLLSLYGIR